MVITMLDGANLRALKSVVKYLYEDEQKHYQSMRENREDTRRHIFPKLRRLKQWLEDAGINMDDLN